MPISAFFVVLSCILALEPASVCLVDPLTVLTAPLAETISFTGEASDVVLSAKEVMAWDYDTGKVLYARAAHERRPVASLGKVLAALTVLDTLADDQVVAIPPEVRAVQRQGADIGLPVGEHATVGELLRAGLVASANDALVTLAVAARGSEEAFVEAVNVKAAALGLTDTRLSNATGLTGGMQFSTAMDLRKILMRAYREPRLQPYFSAQTGTLVTREGRRLPYKTTNKLLGTYMPILAAKTGYTVEAGENLMVITRGPQGQRVGAIVLGSQDRFSDMKSLVEWLWRNYTWRNI